MSMVTRFFTLIGASILLAGCPGELQDPDRFVIEPGDGDYVDCLTYTESMLVKDCALSGCHDSVTTSEGLDLESTNIGGRLLGIEDSNCGGPLITPSAPDESMLYLKMTDDPPCGSRMPLGLAPATAAELDCVLEWIAAQ